MYYNQQLSLEQICLDSEIGKQFWRLTRDKKQLSAKEQNQLVNVIAQFTIKKEILIGTDEMKFLAEMIVQRFTQENLVKININI